MKMAFGMSRFLAYRKFINRKYQQGESIEVYYNSIKSLGIASSDMIMMAFINGLPSNVAQELLKQSTMVSIK